MVQAHVEFGEGIIFEDFALFKAFLRGLKRFHFSFCLPWFKKELVPFVPRHLQDSIKTITTDILLIKEYYLSILVTFSETSCLYEICKKSCLRDLVEETLWVLRIAHFQEGVCVEEISGVEKYIFGGIRSILKVYYES